MGDFRVILLSEANRPVRKARESGAFSLIPFPENGRAGMASSALPTDRDIKPEDLADWFSPMEAIGYAANCVGLKGASNAVWQLLVAGMIEAVASSSSMTQKDRAPQTSNQPTIIPKRLWKGLTDHGSDLWNGGYARFRLIRGDHSATTYQFFGIKLNPDDVRSNLPQPQPHLIESAAPTPETAPAEITNKGGRPRKDWWDDFWIEICRQIWIGDLQPKTQADLERAMFEWVENHRNAEIGETTVKAAARKLFKAWSLGSKT
jgi:hypothetical protein